MTGPTYPDENREAPGSNRAPADPYVRMRCRTGTDHKGVLMSASTSAHAGDLKRIVSDSSDFGTFGRFTETPVAEMDVHMKSAYEYTLELRGMVPGPHKIYLANPKLLRALVPTGAYFQTESTLTKAEIEIVTNVIAGRWGAGIRQPRAREDRHRTGAPRAGESRGADRRPRDLVRRSSRAGRLRALVDARGGSRRTGWVTATRAGPAGRCGHRRCHRTDGLVHRRLSDPDDLRRAVQRGRAGPRVP
jgi:hypothetical protein